ncbi:hypothetical protein HG530_005461 [Fusarium avenaceum]|nr:hypothetical protein HG530_005461 [Fusarium avenaceum]
MRVCIDGCKTILQHLGAILQLLRLKIAVSSRILHIGLESSLPRAEVFNNGLVDKLSHIFKMIAWGTAKPEASVAVQLSKTNPVLLICLVLLVLELALVVDVGKKVGTLEIVVVVVFGLRVAVVLGRNETRLHKVAPDIKSKKCHGTLADPVGLSTDSELNNAIVLATKGDKTAYLRPVASLNIATQELAALGDTDGINRRCCREDWMLGKFLANLTDLVGDVASEGGGTVLVRVFIYGNDVDEGAGIDGFGHSLNVLQAFAVKLVTKAMPNNDRKWSVGQVICRVSRCSVGMASQSSYGYANLEQGMTKHGNNENVVQMMKVE